MKKFEMPTFITKDNASMTQDYRERIYPRYTTYHTPAACDSNEFNLHQNAGPLLHRFRLWLPTDRNACCLDVACGTGQLLYALKQAGYKNLYGVDISAEQVAFARSVWPQVEQAEAITFLRKNPNTFDLIAGLDIIEHFRKDELFSFIDALFAALRPGGRLILQTPNAETPWGLAVRYGDFTHELAFTPESLSRVLRIASFVNCENRECPPFVHGVKSAVRGFLWKFCRTIMALWNLVEIGSLGSGIYTRVLTLTLPRRLTYLSLSARLVRPM